MRYWFGGVAWRIIRGWAESRDAKRALGHVWAELDECFGQEELSPQDRLSDILEMGKINEEDPEELCSWRLTLEPSISGQKKVAVNTN